MGVVKTFLLTGQEKCATGNGELLSSTGQIMGAAFNVFFNQKNIRLFPAKNLHKGGTKFNFRILDSQKEKY